MKTTYPKTLAVAVALFTIFSTLAEARAQTPNTAFQIKDAVYLFVYDEQCPLDVPLTEGSRNLVDQIIGQYSGVDRSVAISDVRAELAKIGRAQFCNYAKIAIGNRILRLNAIAAGTWRGE